MLEALLILAAASGQTADPLAPAREGKVQCVSPNVEKKTCMAIATYDVRVDGSYDAVTIALISPAPMITMETRSTGKIENGAVCGLIKRDDYANSVFMLDGKPADASVAEAVKAQMLPALASMEGKNGCSRERAEGGLQVAEITLDGVARPELTQRLIWVKPDQGYKLGQ
jgi:hypothetical protein